MWAGHGGEPGAEGAHVFLTPEVSYAARHAELVPGDAQHSVPWLLSVLTSCAEASTAHGSRQSARTEVRAVAVAIRRSVMTITFLRGPRVNLRRTEAPCWS